MPTVNIPAGVAQSIAAGKLNNAAEEYEHEVSGADGSDVTINGSVYVLVPRMTLKDATVVPAFYCGKYVSSQLNASTAQSTATGAPWTGMKWSDAKTYCTNAGAAMISENQWLAIAFNCLNVTANWRDGVIGSTVASGGGMYQGLSSAVSAQTPNGTVPGQESIEHRIKTLSNGAQIWDIGGNVWQWIDFSMASYTGATGQSVWLELTDASITNTKIQPGNAYNSAHGMGQIFNRTQGNPIYRGGSFNEGAYTGAFALQIATNANTVGPGIRMTRP